MHYSACKKNNYAANYNPTGHTPFTVFVFFLVAGSPLEVRVPSSLNRLNLL